MDAPGGYYMSVVRRLVWLSVSFWLLSGSWHPAWSMATDTRVLIDISGSMKQNDPGNLRRPALRLLVGLLPSESRAGVWTFGQYVNMQVPLGKVDQGWKDKARAGAGEIHSRGLFTNIEEVLRRATADWSKEPGSQQRHVLLLTDGVVDVSKDPAESADSRARILDQLLPALQAKQARLHTIALSDRADHALLRRLASQTGGWYEQVQQADQLQRVFMRIFEQVAQPDTVPLRNNRFSIDDSISEATLLVFRADPAPPSKLLSPGGRVISAEQPPKGVEWHRDQGYDLVTIANPEAGEWQLQAAVDPDNRVVVVTDLKMRLSELPNSLLLGEQLPLQIEFTENDSTIVDQGFLELLNLQGEMLGDNQATEPIPIRDDGGAGDEQPADGRFTWLIGSGLSAGRAELVVSAEGKTFQRQQRRLLELISPVAVEVSQAGAADSAGIAVRMTPKPGLLEPASVTFQALLESDSGQQQVQPLQQTGSGVWQANLDPTMLTGTWQLGVSLTATSAAGLPVNLDLEPIPIEGASAAQIPPIVPPPPTEPVLSPEPEDGQWLTHAAIFGTGNLVALLLAGGTVLVVRRRNARDNVQLVVEEEEKPGKGSEDE